MSDGLYKHLKLLGHDVEILYDGNFWLSKTPLLKVLLSDMYKLIQNIIHRKPMYFLRFIPMLMFKHRFMNHILNADCLIVVDNCPNVYFKERISRLEDLRYIYKGPIVNYDLHYLPNQGWYGMIKENNAANFGLERFDWYLPASLVTEYAIPKAIPHIYDCIGFDLQSDDLFPEQSEFLAVLDFPHKGWEEEREVQIKALKETHTKYICLTGKYTRSEIRTIYRKCNIFFTSVRESFSMPVLEIQLCGGLIFTPYREWLPAHFLGKDIYTKGSGKLGSNFVVYENKLELLKDHILRCKSTFNSKENIHNFKREYPNYHTISDENLKVFCDRISLGQINKLTHKEFEQYNQYISVSDKVLIK